MSLNSGDVMDLFNLLLIVHLGAFALGVTTTIAAPMVMARAGRAPAEARGLFMEIGSRLRLNARIAVATLIVTGIAMMYVRYGGFAGQSPWFHVKMTCVVVIVLVLLAGIFLKPGKIPQPVLTGATRIAMAGAVISAVMAFN
jgi:putative membrane protein